MAIFHSTHENETRDNSPGIVHAALSSSEAVPDDEKVWDAEQVIVEDWPNETEVNLRRKLDFIVIPMLMLGLFSLQLDKGNLSYALTTSFTKDLGIDNDNVNYGQQLMLAAIIIFEIPFNMILSRTGPARWLTVQIFAWSVIATAQAAIHNLAGFYATRFLLGMWEAGYLAASLTILNSFYTRKEMAMRVTLVYIGNYFSSGVGGLIAGGIFSISESSGLKKWQWLFIIDGLFGLLVGVAFILFMPSSPTKTVPQCGIKRFDFFSDEERRILKHRVVLDDPRKVVDLTSISFRSLTKILLTSFQIWGHFAINVISLTPKGGLGTYGPTLIKNLGFSAVTASFLSSVHNFGVCIFALGVAWVSDRLSMRGLICLICGIYCTVFAGVQFSLIRSSDVWLKYAILTLFTSGVAVPQSLNDAWFSVNTANPQERCIGLALAVAGSNLGGLSGQNIFRKKDAPLYEPGFLKIIYIYAGSIGIVVVMMLFYWNDNRLLAKRCDHGQVVDNNGTEMIITTDRTMVVKNQI